MLKIQRIRLKTLTLIYIILTEIDIITTVIGMDTGHKELNIIGGMLIILVNVMICMLISLFVGLNEYRKFRIKHYKIIFTSLLILVMIRYTINIWNIIILLQ